MNTPDTTDGGVMLTLSLAKHPIQTTAGGVGYNNKSSLITAEGALYAINQALVMILDQYAPFIKSNGNFADLNAAYLGITVGNSAWDDIRLGIDGSFAMENVVNPTNKDISTVSENTECIQLFETGINILSCTLPSPADGIRQLFCVGKIDSATGRVDIVAGSGGTTIYSIYDQSFMWLYSDGTKYHKIMEGGNNPFDVAGDSYYRGHYVIGDGVTNGIVRVLGILGSYRHGGGFYNGDGYYSRMYEPFDDITCLQGSDGIILSTEYEEDIQDIGYFRFMQSGKISDYVEFLGTATLTNGDATVTLSTADSNMKAGDELFIMYDRGSVWDYDNSFAIASVTSTTEFELDSGWATTTTSTARIFRKTHETDLTNANKYEDYIEVSDDYTVTDTDGVVYIDVTTGATDKTITLPTLADNDKRMLVITKVDSGVGNVIIDGEGAETINGATTKTITSQYSSMTIHATTSEWRIR